MKVKSLSPIRLLATPWTAAHQAPPSMEFSRLENLEWGAIAFSAKQVTKADFYGNTDQMDLLPHLFKMVLSEQDQGQCDSATPIFVTVDIWYLLTLDEKME